MYSAYIDQFKRPDNTNITTLAPSGGSYTEVTEAFEVVSGKLKAINLAAHLATLDAPVMSSADYYVQAVVKIASGFGSQIGLILRYVDSSNYYYARIASVAQTLKIFKVVAGVSTELGTYSGGYGENTDYTLKFSATGTTLKAFVNGTERISVTDSAFASAGKPGFWADYGNGTWTNFAVIGDMTRTALPAIAEDYAQPPLPIPTIGFGFMCIDKQVTTKSDNWNQDATKRGNEADEIVATGATHACLGIPFENLTKYYAEVATCRAKGLKVFHRGHPNAWEGDNSLPVGLSRDDYNTDFYRFAVANPTLFEAGDIVGVCVEPNNANDHGNYTFRNPETSGGSFDITKFNQFIKDQAKYANAAMKAIGLEKQVYTWGIAPSLSLVDLAGYQLDSGTGGTGTGIDNAFVRDYLGGVLCTDHYMSDAYRDDDNYGYKYALDLERLHMAFPDCWIFPTEWGYHTTTSVSDAEQAAVFADVIDVSLLRKNFIIGMSFWVQMGSNTASMWADSGGSIVAGGRASVDEVIRAFTSNPYNKTGKLPMFRPQINS